MASHMDGPHVERYLVHILSPVYRIMDETVIREPQLGKPFLLHPYETPLTVHDRRAKDTGNRTSISSADKVRHDSVRGGLRTSP